MPPNVLPSPSDFGVGPVAGWFFTIYCGTLLFAIALVWAIWTGFRRRNWLPTLLLGGGLLCSLLEPMIDFVGHLRWANDLPIYAFTNFGIQVPLFIPFAYGTLIGLEAYFWSRLFRQGMTVRQVFLAFAVAGLSDAAMETPGLLLHVYEYYGVQPYRFLGFPYWWAFVNGAGFITIGFLVWYLEPKLKGWYRAGFLFVGPFGFMVAYWAVSWPHFLALNATLPTAVKWIATTVTMIMCLIWIRAIASVVAVDEKTMHWTFGRLLLLRLMLPHQRERMLQRAKVPAPPGREPADTPRTEAAGV